MANRELIPSHHGCEQRDGLFLAAFGWRWRGKAGFKPLRAP